MGEGDLEKSRAHLERASELSPDVGSIYAALARLYRRLGENDKAVEAAGRVMTSAASIPIALDEKVRANQVPDGTTMIMCGLGAGLTWGAAAIRW